MRGCCPGRPACTAMSWVFGGMKAFWSVVDSVDRFGRALDRRHGCITQSKLGASATSARYCSRRRWWSAVLTRPRRHDVLLELKIEAKRSEGAEGKGPSHLPPSLLRCAYARLLPSARHGHLCMPRGKFNQSPFPHTLATCTEGQLAWIHRQPAAGAPCSDKLTAAGDRLDPRPTPS